MATFYPFPRLPLEIRMQVWEFAFVDDRVLKVRRLHLRKGYSSPSPVPAVTRACHESRKYCSYQKAFVVDGSSRYIWAKFDSDIIQMLGSVLSELITDDHPEKKETRRLRIEMAIGSVYDDYELEFFHHNYSHRIRDLPRLESCDILVHDGLHNWCTFIEEMYWGPCPKSNVRVIDAKTGEWIDANTSGPYIDWIDTGGGQTTDYNRIDDYWDEEDDEDVAKRYEAMMKMKEPLPRINLNLN